MNFALRDSSLSSLDQLIWWSIVALILFLIFSVAAGQALAIFLVLLFIIKSVKQKKIGIKKNPLILPFIVFIISRILAVLFSEYPQLSLQSLNKEIFFYAVFFAILSFPYMIRKQNLKFIIRLLIFTAIFAALIGTIKVLTGMNVRASSTTSGYYTLGMYLSVIFSMILVLGKNKEIINSRIGWGLILLLIMIGILFTQNRIHWITIALFILIIGLIRERILLTITILIFVCVIILSPSLSERFSQLIHFTQNFSDRDVLWKGAFKIFDLHPVIGFGTKTFSEIFPLFNELTDKGINGWHCDYIQVYIEGGIIGFLSFIWLISSIYYFGIKNLKRIKGDKFYFDINISVLTGLSVLFITGFVGGFFLDPICSILFQILLAIQALLINVELQKE